MLYIIVKWIVRLTLNSYFRRIVMTGLHNIPDRGAVIFVANHPSAFMDPMVVATCISRSTHFLAAAEFFGKGLKSWLYKKYLNMIPVYRPSTLSNEPHNNETIFSHCFELLGNGGALLIFPEGNSITEKRIRKLKTGVARMALGARDHLQNRGDVKIVPIGLNYNNPHRFQSDLFINIGNPISTNTYGVDHTEVIRLTNEVEERLKETVLHVQHQELDSLVKKVELILKNESSIDEKSLPHKKEAEFAFHQKVITSIQTLNKNYPQQIPELELRLDNYLNRIKKLGVSDGAIGDFSILITALELFRLILALPLFLMGVITNSIPYYATVYYFRRLNFFPREGHEPPRKKINQAFKGSIAMGIGMFFFIGCYLILAICFSLVAHNAWVGIFSLIVFYLSGLFTMRYLRWMILLKQQLKLRQLLNNQKGLFKSLIIEREKIIEELMLITK